MIEFREVNLEDDLEFVQDMFVGRAFENARAEARRAGLSLFKEQWLESPQGRALIEAFESSLGQVGTLARVVYTHGSRAGLVWVTRGTEPGQPPYAELRLLAFYLHFQRQGLGRRTLFFVEDMLREQGIEVLRSTGASPSEAVRRFHEATGFEAVQTVFEKQLSTVASAS